MNEEIRSIVEEHLKIFAKALIDVVDSGRYIRAADISDFTVNYLENWRLENG